ncbi:hypothetical protein [Bacillus sp. JJ722]|uniref:hypothetical protein n=1 Tax=Bacillus sp. JJ722 TaxID=3122973 RepID=UPI002FFFFD68
MINLVDDMTYFINEVGKDITIGDVTVKALIKSFPVGDFDDKEISTLHPIKRGNIVEFDEIDYLVISESVSKKPLLFKAKMRNINHTIIKKGEIVPIKWDKFGNPIEWTEGEDKTFYCIVDTQKFAIAEGAVRVATGEIIITIADNEEYRSEFAINSTVDVVGGTYKVVNHDLTKKGLITMTCEKVTV